MPPCSAVNRRFARKTAVRGEAAVHGDDVAIGIGVHDELGAHDRQAVDALLQTDVGLTHLIREFAGRLEALRACRVEQVLLLLEEVLRGDVHASGAQFTEASFDELGATTDGRALHARRVVCVVELTERRRRGHEDYCCK
jgi:hypothetical protein